MSFARTVLATLLLLPSAAHAAEPPKVLSSTGFIHWIAFTHDGKQLLAAGQSGRDGKSASTDLRMWDVAAGKLNAGPIETEAVWASGTVSSDGKLALTGDAEGRWKLWSLPALKPLAARQVPDWTAGRVDRVVFGPQDKTFTVLIMDPSKRLRDPIKLGRRTYRAYTYRTDTRERVGDWVLWPTEQPKIARDRKEPPDGLPAGWPLGAIPEFDPDGRPRPPKGDAAFPLEIPDDHPNCGGPVVYAVSPDRKWAVNTGCNGHVVLWDFTTRKPVGEPLSKSGGILDSVAFSADGRRIAVGTTVYDRVTRRVVAGPFRPAEGEIESGVGVLATFSPDGKYLATVTRRRQGDDILQEVLLWQLPKEK